jgi:acid phosphatase type 7
MKASSGSYSVNFPASKQKSWHLIGLNPYGSSASDWLKQDLKDSQSKPCVLAFTHPFYYSSGYHGHRDKKSKNANKRPLSFMQNYFKLLHAKRVTVLLAGHDHHFEQLGRANASGAADNEHGLRSFIVGTGGKALYNIPYAKQWPFQEAIDLRNYGILRIDLFAVHYEWEFIPVQPAADSMVVKKSVKSDRCNRPTI